MPADLDPKKYFVLTPLQRRNFVLIALLVLFLITPVFGYFYYSFAIGRPAQTRYEATFEIKKGVGVADIAANLYSRDLLNSHYLFTFYVLINGFDENIQAGVYTIPAGSSVIDLAEQFQHGTNDISITFLEGWRIEEFAIEASQTFENVDYEDFVELAWDDKGFLFPDTYFFTKEVNAEEIVERLKDTFKDKTSNLLSVKALKDLGLSEKEVVTLASLVEREVIEDTDRRVVAGILISRLRNGVTLGVDATNQYLSVDLRARCLEIHDTVCPSDDVALETDWWPKNLTNEDLTADHPYNTRKNLGLPPTPISSISLSALQAVLDYTDTDYNYYLTDMEGITHYTTTLDEHIDNTYRYLRE